MNADLKARDAQHLAALKELFSARTLEHEGLSNSTAVAAADKSQSISEALERLGTRLVGSNYHLEEIPVSDLHGELTIDLSRGDLVGTAKWTNPARPENGLGRDLAERLASVIPSLSRQGFAEIERAAVEGSTKTIINAIRSAAILLPEEQRQLGELLANLDPHKLDAEDQKTFYEHLIRGSLDNPKRLERTIDRLLLGHADSLSKEELAEYRLVRAGAMASQGGVETALQLWRDLIAGEGREFAHVRAAAHAATAHALDATDPDALAHARRAADAYLESGRRTDAVRALVYCAQCLFHVDVKNGMAVLRDAEALRGLDGAFDRESRARLLHLRASMHLDMGDWAAALRDAKAAAQLRTGLLHVEPARYASLMLAIDAARELGDANEEAALLHSAAQLQDSVQSLLSSQWDDIAEFIKNYDPAVADRVRHRAALEGDLGMPAMLVILKASGDASLAPAERLRQLEAAAAELDSAPRRNDAEVGLMAVAQELIQQEQLTRAARVYAKILARNPVSHFARQQYAALLQRTQAWKELAEFAAGEIRRFGNAPGRLLIRGRALLELGDANAALRELQQALSLAEPDTVVALEARRWREEALTLGASGILPKNTLTARRVISVFDLRACLSEFSRFVSNEKRKQYWKAEKRQHRWRPSPERIAHSELHTFLKASFSDGIETFEEVSSGAGRIDLYVLLSGGARVVIELKMCGLTYPSSYAFEGIEQITHYMTNRRTSVGLLVIFDARAHDYGKGLSAVEMVGEQTVYCYFVDVRPTVKEPRGRRARP
jgi:tetratricopeptide (TPR) repeat protein